MEANCSGLGNVQVGEVDVFFCIVSLPYSCFSSPAVGYFNDDDTPDIMIHYQTGPGYPLYYSAQVLQES